MTQGRQHQFLGGATTPVPAVSEHSGDLPWRRSIRKRARAGGPAAPRFVVVTGYAALVPDPPVLLPNRGPQPWRCTPLVSPGSSAREPRLAPMLVRSSRRWRRPGSSPIVQRRGQAECPPQKQKRKTWSPARRQRRQLGGA